MNASKNIVISAALEEPRSGCLYHVGCSEHTHDKLSDTIYMSTEATQPILFEMQH